MLWNEAKIIIAGGLLMLALATLSLVQSGATQAIIRLLRSL